MGSCKMSNAQETVAKEYAIKLMLCKAKKKILFAEVPSDFMDCWLNFLQKPFYEIVSSTRNNACATWKGSIDRLPTTLFNENPCKDSSSGSSQLSIKFTNYNKLRVAVVVNQLRAYVARDVSRITSVNHVL